MIQLDGNAFNVWFQEYSFGDEGKFRKLISDRDNWYSTQSPKVYEKWLDQTTKWLSRNKHKHDEGFGQAGSIQ